MKKFLVLALSFNFALLAIERMNKELTFEPHTLEKGEWISKLLISRDMKSKEMLDATLAKNELTYQQAKKLEIGQTVLLPVMKKETVAKADKAIIDAELAELDLELQEDIVETKEAAPIKSETAVDAEDMNNDKSSSINAAIGVFAADDRFHKRNADITRDLNTRVMIGGEIAINNDMVKSINLNGFTELYDEGRFSDNDTEDRLNNSYGIAISAPISLTEKMIIAPELMASNNSSYDFNNDEELKERNDNNGWIGLLLSYQMGEFTPYAKYSHLSSTDDSDSDFDALRASVNKLGLNYNKGDFMAGLYWQYTDWNMETKDFTRDIGLNIGYRF